MLGAEAQRGDGALMSGQDVQQPPRLQRPYVDLKRVHGPCESGEAAAKQEVSALCVVCRQHE